MVENYHVHKEWQCFITKERTGMVQTSSATETSFLNQQDGEYEEERNGEEDIISGADNMDERITSWKVK